MSVAHDNWDYGPREAVRLVGLENFGGFTDQIMTDPRLT